MEKTYQISITARYPESPGESLTCCFTEVRTCPICHHAAKPNILQAYALGDDEKISVVYHCPACDNIFLATYSDPDDISDCHEPIKLFFEELENLAPQTPEGISIPECVGTISPDFCEIYGQAAAAEAAGLDQVCGSGYRKALEFLVKDYLSGKYPEKEEEIKKNSLGNAISKIESPRIQTLAQRSSWLGNDETHYVRKHEDRDVSDMQRFIHAILTFIVAEQAVEDALSIPSK